MQYIMNKEYRVEEVEALALELKKILPKCAVMTFQGTLGAGKTTLIAALLRSCGVKEVVTSPTFTYVNCYKNDQSETFYHFDCYRLESLQSFLDAGFEEYLYASRSWAFIEWPEVIEPLLKTGVCKVFLEYSGVEKRHIKVALL